MHGESSTVPVSPPPGPVTSGEGLPSPGISPQQLLASEVAASSKVTISKPSRLNAGEAVIRGTQFCRNSSAEASPPGRPFLQGESWPSLHRSGVMNE